MSATSIGGSDQQIIGLTFKAGNTVAGGRAAGAPFRVYAVRPYQSEMMRAWDYSVAAGDALHDNWAISDFETGQYHLRVYGPNGFYREFISGADNPILQIECGYEFQRLLRHKLTGNLQLTFHNRDTKAHSLTLVDNSYGAKPQQVRLSAGARITIPIELNRQHGWYDLSVQVKGYDGFEERFAGHVETGSPSKTDPLMARVA